MRFLTPILGLLTLLVPFIAADQDANLAQLPFSAFQPSDYLNSTGLTDDVQWDGYSLFIKGQRIYLYSGEIHSESRLHPHLILSVLRLMVLIDSRVPNPEFYLDIMQRLKAIGFNAISHYPLWGLVNPSPGVFDFEGWKSLEPFLQAANDAGLWVVTRPGPYVVCTRLFLSLYPHDGPADNLFRVECRVRCGWYPLLGDGSSRCPAEDVRSGLDGRVHALLGEDWRYHQ